MCGHRGGAALAAQGRAVREVVHELHYRLPFALHRRATEVPQPRV